MTLQLQHLESSQLRCPPNPVFCKSGWDRMEHTGQEVASSSDQDPKHPNALDLNSWDRFDRGAEEFKTRTHQLVQQYMYGDAMHMGAVRWPQLEEVDAETGNFSADRVAVKPMEWHIRKIRKFRKNGLPP